VPPASPLPNHVVIHALDAESRRATLAVAASLLRHVAAEAIYLGIQPATSGESERGIYMRELLDARSSALTDHGLDMRTELRPGAVAEELQKELAAYERSMLVLGTSNPAALSRDWLKALLDSSPARPVLIVNSARAEVTADA
jgi:hypothetical protein